MPDKTSSIEMCRSKYINKHLKIMMAQSPSGIISTPSSGQSRYSIARLVIPKDSCSIPPIQRKDKTIRATWISSQRTSCSSIGPSTCPPETEIAAQSSPTPMGLLTGPERFKMYPTLPDWPATKEAASLQLNPHSMKSQGLSK